MGLLGRKHPYNRSECLAAAAKARAKGRTKQAIRHYQEILDNEPDNIDVHAKIAPLLAQINALERAQASFIAAAHGYHERGFADKAIGIYRGALRHFPREVGLWSEMAELQIHRNRSADAVRTLIEGSQHFRTGRLRPQAVHLLQRALEIEPCHFDASLALAQTLTRMGQRAKAKEMLNTLVSQTSGLQHRRVRAAQFRLAPTPAAAWRWFRARS